ncbi:MAG: RIP metalloprotease RseP [Alphaproteobacteria bacterium]|nr:RIP metalloprotease RseP [Alphaproteobacteria bacterium]
MGLIESVFLTVFSFGFVISIVVVIHELGHYWAGRWCGVHAEAFSVGFGPTLLSWRDKHGTVWRVAAFPLGGYVRFLGDAGAASEPDSEKLDQMRAQMGADADKCYHFKPVWQRSIITGAGPVANFILAILVFALLAMVIGGPQHNPALVGDTLPGSPAEEAGFQSGDRIVSINGKAISSFQDITQEVIWRPGQELAFEIDRGGEVLILPVAPRATEIVDNFGGTRRMGQVGLSALLQPVIGRLEAGGAAEAAGFQIGDRILSVSGEPVLSWHQIDNAVAAADGDVLRFEIEREGRSSIIDASLPYYAEAAPEAVMQNGRISMRTVGNIWQRDRFGPIGAVMHGAERTWAAVSMTGRYVGHIVTGRASTELLNGPLGIAEAAGQTASSSVEAGRNASESAILLILNLIQLAGYLSVGLGLVNLLPIPILDGGHLVYYAYEAVARRPLSMKAQTIGFQLGLALVLGMMLLATWNDINYKLSQFF